MRAAEHDPVADAKALAVLARWALRFSPVVVVEHPDALVVDLTGTERCLGPTIEVMRRAYGLLRRAGLTARMAVAPTPGAAWALASAGRNGTIVDETPGWQAALDTLPPAALRIEPEAADVLHRLGIEAVGQLRKLRRDELPARFGEALLARMDRVMGEVPELLITPRLPGRRRERLDFDHGGEGGGVVTSQEAVCLALEQLAEKLTLSLRLSDRGARRLAVRFGRPYLPTVEKELRLARPSRDLKRWAELLRRIAEEVPCDDGFTGVELEVLDEATLGDEQTDFLGVRSVHDEAWARLVEGLEQRLGEGRVVVPRLIESHVPERGAGEGFAICDVAAISGFDLRLEGGRGLWGGKSQIGAASAAKSRIANGGAADPESRIENLPEADRGFRRPLRLFASPKEVRVIVAPHEDREGRPVAVHGERGTSWNIVHAAGPRRISGRWWEGHGKTRDYFDAETEQGRRLWLFRVLENGRWFWQGEW